MTNAPGDWIEPDRERHRIELADGRVVVALAFTGPNEVPGRYRVRDVAGRVFVVSADDVIGELESARRRPSRLKVARALLKAPAPKRKPRKRRSTKSEAS